MDAQLDEWRTLRDGGKDGIARIQMEERATNRNQFSEGRLQSRVRLFHRGYEYHAHLVPADYQRRQTLTGAERYVTPALKEFEEKF